MSKDQIKGLEVDGIVVMALAVMVQCIIVAGYFLVPSGLRAVELMFLSQVPIP